MREAFLDEGIDIEVLQQMKKVFFIFLKINHRNLVMGIENSGEWGR